MAEFLRSTVKSNILYVTLIRENYLELREKKHKTFGVDFVIFIDTHQTSRLVCFLK